ncbi:hypothetical protein HK405_006588, partial [Cladochytrium tenue]
SQPAVSPLQPSAVTRPIRPLPSSSTAAAAGYLNAGHDIMFFGRTYLEDAGHWAPDKAGATPSMLTMQVPLSVGTAALTTPTRRDAAPTDDRRSSAVVWDIVTSGTDASPLATPAAVSGKPSTATSSLQTLRPLTPPASGGRRARGRASTYGGSGAGEASSVCVGHAGGPEKRAALFRTELCASWLETGTCRFGQRCDYAHCAAELRPVPRHPSWKTKLCNKFWTQGSCPYGTRCAFIHELGPSTVAAALSSSTAEPAGAEPAALAAAAISVAESLTASRAALDARRASSERVESIWTETSRHRKSTPPLPQPPQPVLLLASLPVNETGRLTGTVGGGGCTILADGWGRGPDGNTWLNWDTSDGGMGTGLARTAEDESGIISGKGPQMTLPTSYTLFGECGLHLECWLDAATGLRTRRPQRVWEAS